MSDSQGPISREKGWARKPTVFASGSSEVKQGEAAEKEASHSKCSGETTKRI